jgi:hypothetical protein
MGALHARMIFAVSTSGAPPARLRFCQRFHAGEEFRTSAGAKLRLAKGLTLIDKFDGELASHSFTYAGTGAVRYTW